MSTTTASTTAAWMLSAPANPTKQDTIAKLRDRLEKAEYANIYPFTIPDFKVGTLDSLILLSDELVKCEGVVEAVCLKICEALKALLSGGASSSTPATSNTTNGGTSDPTEIWKNSLLVGGDKTIIGYLTSPPSGLSWNTMKYRSDKTLKELVDLIMLEVGGIEGVMKGKMGNYSAVKTALGVIQRKNTGNLSVKNLSDLVKKEHFVAEGSEYLTTLLVAVPKANVKEWVDNYELLTAMVVPRSSQKIVEDDDYALFNVTLFLKVVDEFTTKCRERKWIVRDFKWNAEQLSEEKKKYNDLVTAEKDQWASLIRLCKANFGEIYASWIHLKILRLFIESILRYGLPPDFQPILVVAKPKQDKKVRQLLNKHYAYLDKSNGGAGGGGGGGGGSKEEGGGEVDENLATLIGEKEYSPCVLYPVNTIL